ncbi:signal recognition particle-docking protein FtsY [Chromobacterium subtsugae]|uniref:signal recognition particle-docking protein FtsY n=1 Tax=Chromobacterium subtsugae TaxID=251747 RepID=UPI0007F89715|nr:signal recognition particle-docking protein FtsY [Chromobacterium subtsugae]OBU87663.1 cell division protein FtsY [Chromobacterium subtsugae]
MFSFFKKKPKPVETPQTETPAAVVDAAPALIAEPASPAAAALEAPAPAPAPDAVGDLPAETAAAVAPPVPSEDAAPTPLKKMSWTERLKAGLAKTRDRLGKQLAGLFGGGKIDEELYEELETVLLTADMGMDATVHLLKDVRERVSLKGLKDSSELKGALKDSLQDLIGPLEVPLDVEGKKPFVIMMTGVNGAGKTTSIGKLAKYYQSQGKSVLLAAGDTFRAAAREQLIAWGERNDVTVIAQQGGDSAAVCYDAIQAAIARGIDIVLADTAGRLPTQLHLMEEIKKVKRVIQKALPDAPHEVVLVLDANIGQNTVNQVKAFDDALGLTGLILTKLDGTAKGGVIAAIAKQRPIPLRFIGVGESIDDLRPFDSRDYIDALFE